ncbi:P27 family phage terminase small subunit [Sporosarcina contaminans]|uniref:P27 family phage terminase small subunit n=1 Tax=Sporosarcina contaminans TaxID=633403 RepID=A0ABW3TU38_9BACL
MAKLLTKKQLKKSVVDNMKHLGVYRENYEHTIDVYVGMLAQYQAFEKQFEESGYQITVEYTNKAGATNDRKTPIYSAMESLRKDLATYSNLLCINPKAFESVKKREVPVRKKETEKPQSKLVQALGEDP